MYQGFTGKQATVNAVQNIQFGTNVVGGVTPGRWGKHLGLPLCGSVKEVRNVFSSPLGLKMRVLMRLDDRQRRF